MNDVELCDADALANFRWPDGTEYEQAYLTPLMQLGTLPFFANVETKMMLAHVGTFVFPVTINDREYDNSYVCSPYTGMISYPREELVKLPSRALRMSLKALIACVAPLVRAAQINKVVGVNNWLLSTNLYPAWDGAGLSELTRTLCRHSPDRAIMFRSLNRVTNAALCDRFVEAGYHLVPSRQVFLFDGTDPALLRKQDTRRDLKLIGNTSYRIIPHEHLTADQDEEVVRLYELLYLHKYSLHNPRFTTPLIRLWREKGLMQLFGLRNPEGKLDGAVGFFARNQVMTSPLVGYDTSLPYELGLYRMLSALVIRESARQKMTLNMSSGVAAFKRLRGGIPHVEYTAVYYDHLPMYRRSVWRTLSFLLTEIGVRVLEKYEI